MHECVRSLQSALQPLLQNPMAEPTESDFKAAQALKAALRGVDIDKEGFGWTDGLDWEWLTMLLDDRLKQWEKFFNARNHQWTA